MTCKASARTRGLGSSHAAKIISHSGTIQEYSQGQSERTRPARAHSSSGSKSPNVLCQISLTLSFCSRRLIVPPLKEHRSPQQEYCHDDRRKHLPVSHYRNPAPRAGVRLCVMYFIHPPPFEGSKRRLRKLYRIKQHGC